MTDALRLLPLAAQHEALGARFAPFAGYAMPVRYGSIKDEHHAVRRRCGMFDVSHMGEVFVRGPGALAAVDRLITNDVTRLVDGQALYTAMCAPDGGIVDDLIVYRLGAEEVLICVNAANRAGDVAWIAEVVGSDAEVTDESDAFVQLAVQGPQAVHVVTTIAPAAAEVRPFHAAWGPIAGVTCLLSRTGYTGEDGFEIYAPVEHAADVFDAVIAAGREVEMVPVGLGARDTLRLEARLMLYGNDISRTTNPIEAGLGWVVKFGGSDFVGRAALERVVERGPTRRLRGLFLEAPGVLRGGYALFSGEQHVGELTSGGIAPTLDDQSIGLAYIDVPYDDTERLEVEIRGRRLPVRLTKAPFYKRAR